MANLIWLTLPFFITFTISAWKSANEHPELAEDCASANARRAFPRGC